jgi:hypothetical protein
VVAQVSTYVVDVRRGGKYWTVSAPGVDRVTQARHLREVDTMARDLISIMTGAEADSFGLDVRIELPGDARSHLEFAGRFREEAKVAQSRAADEVRTAARALRDSGMPLRDIGTVLGVSHQRADQLVK